MKTLATLAAALALALPAAAQQYVYPAKGQTPEKQKADEAECTAWASKQAGASTQQAAPPSPQQQPVTGSGARARGAAAGAAVGAITGNDTGDAAKAGMVAGAAAQRGANRRAARDQQAAAQSQAQAGQAEMSKARAACLEGKGYTVK